MNKKILTGVTSCTLAAMMLCTGAAAQAVSPQDGTVAWAHYTVPSIMQVEKSYCGVAATQMALIGSGLIPNTSDNRGGKIWGIIMGFHIAIIWL